MSRRDLCQLTDVRSPSEITGVSFTEDQEDVITEIAECIRGCDPAWGEGSSMHMRSVLKKIGRGKGLSRKARQHVEVLLSEIGKEGGRFDYGNLAYQAVVRVVRGWPKGQYHAHIGGSVHPLFAWNLLASGQVTVPQVLARQPDLSEREKLGLLLLRALIQDGPQGALWDQLPDDTRKAVWGLLRDGLLAPKMVVVSPVLFSFQVAHVALQHFSDNVADLLLLIRVTGRDFVTDRDSRDNHMEVIDAAVEGLKAAEKLAKGRYGRQFRARLGVSFPRDGRGRGGRTYPDYVGAVVRDIVNRKRGADSRRVDYVVAVDISGPEALTDDEANTQYWKTSDFREALEAAAGASMHVSAHLGDWGNTYRLWPEDTPRRPGATQDRRMALAEVPDREGMVARFLTFTGDGIDALRRACGRKGPRAAINHGIALAPEGSIITKGPGRGRSFAGERITARANLAEIDRQLRLLKQEGFEIRTCPTVNVRSQEIRLYRGHPLHQWLRRGLDASIHVDDFYWFSGWGTTLSDDVAKMLLAAPEDLPLTLHMARRCCRKRRL